MPSSQSATRRLAGVVGVVLLTSLPATASAAAPADQVVAVDGLRVASPAPGYGVAVTAITIDGGSLDLIVETDPEGDTSIVDAGSLVPGSAAASDTVASGPSACTDGRHNEIGFRWTKPWAWRFNAASTPDGIGRLGAEAQLKSAVRTIVTARNDCGRPDRVSARARYLGRTNRRPGIRSSAECGGFDGRNVVGFGSLPPFIAGVTCTTYTLPSSGWGHAIESDVLLNKRYHKWAIRRRTCSDDRIVLRSVATHEFGHVFGLNHVREAAHGNLTMSEAIGPCDDSAFTLGKGDVIGLERLY